MASIPESIPDMIHVASRPRPYHNSRHAHAPAILPGGIATYARSGGRTFSQNAFSRFAILCAGWRAWLGHNHCV